MIFKNKACFVESDDGLKMKGETEDQTPRKFSKYRSPIIFSLGEKELSNKSLFPAVQLNFILRTKSLNFN